MTASIKNNSSACALCPRECNANRDDDVTGFCQVLSSVKIARAALHMWEEPCISGPYDDNSVGSGAVFFSGCNLRCVFCQNHEISSGTFGEYISTERLSDIFLELQEKGALNINLVTPTHYAIQIKKALEISKNKGLNIPIIYNTSSYEKVETLRELEGLIDVYLPDFKYFDPDLSAKYSKAQDYPQIAMKAISEMVRQHPVPTFSKKGIITSGVVVRHMILPGHTKDSMHILDYLYDTYKNNIYVSIMNQYTPLASVPRLPEVSLPEVSLPGESSPQENLPSACFPELCRKITKREYDKVINHAIDLGMKNAFIQEGVTQSESFIPAFDLEGVMPS